MSRSPTRMAFAAFSILMVALAGVAMKFAPDHVVSPRVMAAPAAAHGAYAVDGVAGPEEGGGEHRSHGRTDCPFCRISDALALPAPPSIPELLEFRIVHVFAVAVHVPPDPRSLRARLGARAPPLA